MTFLRFSFDILRGVFHPTDFWEWDCGRKKKNNDEQQKTFLMATEGWNIFDFVVVAIGILSVLKVPVAATSGMHTPLCPKMQFPRCLNSVIR